MAFLQFERDSLDFVELEALHLERSCLSRELIDVARRFIRRALPLDVPVDASYMSVFQGAHDCPGSLTVLWERPAVESHHVRHRTLAVMDLTMFNLMQEDRGRALLHGIRGLSPELLWEYNMCVTPAMECPLHQLMFQKLLRHTLRSL